MEGKGDLQKTRGIEVFDKVGAFGDDFQSLIDMINGIPAVIYRCLVDGDWTIDFVSDGAVDLTGYSADFLIKNEFGFLFGHVIHPEDRNHVSEMWTGLIAGRQYRLEYRIVTALGEIRWVLDKGRCRRASSGYRFIEGIIVDISKQKQLEEQIKYMGFHDKVTGLYNRSFFEEELRRLDTERQLPLSLILADVNGLKLINDALGHQRGDDMLCSIAVQLRLSCRKEDVISRWGGDEFVIILPKTDEKTARKLCSRIRQSIDSISHEYLHLGVAIGSATKNNVYQDINKIFNEAEEDMYKKKILEAKNSRGIVLESLMHEVFMKEFKTEERIKRLKDIAITFGYSLGLTDSQLEDLEVLSTVCDIGKLSISETILQKPGRLNSSEWAIIWKHPEIGYQIAKTFPELVKVAEYILYHHERWDGKGYPQGLKGSEIPLFSRIMSITQAYDAMTHFRCYARTLSPTNALAEIELCAGTQFDPRLSEVFVSLFHKDFI